MADPTPTQMLIGYIVCCVIGVPTWVAFIFAVQTGLDNRDMRWWDYAISVFFGLIPLIQVIPAGILSIVWLFIGLPVCCWNLVFHGKFTLEP